MQQQEQALRKRVEAFPTDHQAWHALGLLCFDDGRAEQAVHCLRQAIQASPTIALYHRNLGEILRRLGQVGPAIRSGSRACELDPSDVDAHYNLGLAHTDARDYPRAAAAYRSALALNDSHNLSWNNLGSALEQMGDKAGALSAYERAIAIHASHAEAQNNAGAIYTEQGRLDEASRAFEAAIHARPTFVEAHYNLSSLKKYTADDPHLNALKSLYAQRAQFPMDVRIRYAFALAKAYDDIGEDDLAFEAYEEGNRLQHVLMPMQEDRADALIEAIESTFTREFFEQRRAWQGVADPARVPVFIVGMPRSGTTLLEQILCSHPQVHGAGELVDLSDVITQVTRASQSQSFAAQAVHLSEADVRAIGEQYLSRVWKLSPDSVYITDKMPANFFYLGLIHLALPHARIIHAMRDPMDSCFSCFTKLFNDTMEFAYDQGTLGRYYVRYIRLMQHWHKVLAEGTILDLPYEKLIEDTEGQARRVLEFVGLPWDDACLSFYENDRLVRTASVAQVRQPIYKTSVARWRRFGKHLTPLLSIVKDYRTMTPEDHALLQGAPDLDAQARQLALVNQAAQSLHLQGIALYRADRIEQALERFERALAIQPLFPACLNSRGFALQDIGRVQEALASFAQALELAPDMDIARLNLGMAQLKTGDWARGWDNYEARWKGSAEAGAGTLNRPACPLPVWAGEPDTRNQRLLVITEQGFGDTFQFARYLPMLRQRFAKVGFACSIPTQRLMEWSFGDQIVIMTRMPDSSQGYATWDWQCPLMSLPRAFGTRLDSVPAELPYLRVPGPVHRHWAERLQVAAPARIRVGLAWAGRQAHQYDKRRSLRFDQVAMLMEDPRIAWVNLQKWSADDVPDVPSGIDWIDWTTELVDFADTAALVNCLDLVVTIDSAMVHLAGALNRPVWMLDRFDSEWRWLENRLDSPWYPSLRIIRQSAFGQWDGVLQTVRSELRRLVDRHVSVAFDSPSAQPGPVVAAQALQPGALTIEQALGLAAQWQNAGKLQEAQRLLEDLVRHHPQHAHARHLLGVVVYQTGQIEAARQHIAAAISINPNVGHFYTNLAEMCRQHGDVEQAIRLGEQAVALDPSNPVAHSNLGIAYYDAGKYEQAQASHERALELSQNLVQSLNNLGSIARARKDKEEAERWYLQALTVQPDFLEALSNLGAVLVEQDRAGEAEPYLEQALRIQPYYAEALCNLGLVRYKQELNAQAIGLFNKSLQLRPGYMEAMVGLARALREEGQLEQARAILTQTVEKYPENADTWSNLGNLCVEMGDSVAAEEAYERALALEPDLPDALTGMGNLRLEQGEIDESVALFDLAIAHDPDNLGARFHLVQARKVRPDDDNLKALEAVARRMDQPDARRIGTERLISLHYALGKAYDDLKAWDRAFPHFLEGARLKRAKIEYSADEEAAGIDQLIEVMDADFINRFRGAGDPTDVPVFVLGMPRSGTTLTEQIIASHPDVHGAGELAYLMRILHQPPGDGSAGGFPGSLVGMTPETLSRWGTQYLQQLRTHNPQARRITDKMPANYLGLGMIHLMLPNARIIHVKRHPIDTCISCFSRLFNRHQHATYNLYELGRHYANYARLMQHWRSVLPAGAFLEVVYEDIVADQEREARRLIDWVGLPWDDACLSFHKTKRNIRTASVAQVRQPIYKTSVARWRHYEKFLGPLLDGLGDVDTDL